MKIFKLLLLGLLLSVYVPTNFIVGANTLYSEEPVQQQNEDDAILDVEGFEITGSEYTYRNDVSEYISGNDMVEPASTGRIRISFKDMFIGWLIDGVFEYSTGRAPAEWISMGLNTIENRIRAVVANGNGRLPYINVSQNGQVSGCIAFPCHIMSIVDEDIE